MNKELINKYKTEFNHLLKEGKLQQTITGKFPNVWTEYKDAFTTSYRPNEILVVIDDEYVEFRKALAEGKTIQYNAHCHPGISGVWKRDAQLDFHLKPENYRIKPEESEFTYPMWFKSTFDKVVKFTSLTKGIQISGPGMYSNGEEEEWIPHTDTEWTQVPKPKKMIKVAKYRYFNGVRHTTTACYYKHDDEFKLVNHGAHKFERLEEIEVEDY